MGRNTRRAPTSRIASSYGLCLVGAEVVEDDDVARLEGRNEELFDIGAEAFAVDGPVEQAGRVDAVVAQGGKESRGLPAAMRNLCDPLIPTNGFIEWRNSGCPTHPRFSNEWDR